MQSPFFFVHFAESFVPLRVARSLPGTSGQPLAIDALPAPPTTIESGSAAAEPGTSGSAGVSTTKLPPSQAGGFAACALGVARAKAKPAAPSQRFRRGCKSELLHPETYADEPRADLIAT